MPGFSLSGALLFSRLMVPKPPRGKAGFGLTAPHQIINLQSFSASVTKEPQDMDRIKTTTLTGAEIVVRCLQEEGVGYVFGYPGGAVLFIYDELFKQDKVKHV